jgi:hypothetical protein
VLLSVLFWKMATSHALTRDMPCLQQNRKGNLILFSSVSNRRRGQKFIPSVKT